MHTHTYTDAEDARRLLLIIDKKRIWEQKLLYARAHAHTGFMRTGVASLSGIEMTCLTKHISNITQIN
jgi:hypothetical protein